MIPGIKIPVNKFNEASQIMGAMWGYQVSSAFEAWCTTEDLKEMIMDFLEKEGERLEPWSTDEWEFMLGLEEWIASL